MKRTVMVVVVLVVALAMARGQERKQKTDRPGRVARELIKMEQELAEAAMRRDVALLDRFTADDFIGVDPMGREFTKAQVLARFQVPDYELDSLRHEDIRVRVFGNCAVAIGRTVVKGRYKGQDASGEFPYMRVWIKRNGRWQGVAAQSTSIPKP